MNYTIGVDGGGTKTECILVDSSGAVVAHEMGPGCNPSIVGQAKAGRVVEACLHALLAKSPAQSKQSVITKTLLCTAGSREFWQEFAKNLTLFGLISAVDDSIPVLELATDGGPGLVLHAGTGSFVAARAGPAPSDGVCYAGGLGWRFGDPGSADDLGRRAIARAVLELQGWMSRSGLSALVEEELGHSDPGAVLSFFYSKSPPNPRVATLAPAVLRLATEGDSAAHAIVVDSTSKLLDLAVRVATKLFPTKPIAILRAGLSGPILTHPAVVRILSSRSPLSLKPVQGTPIEGVRRILMRA